MNVSQHVSMVADGLLAIHPTKLAADDSSSSSTFTNLSSTFQISYVDGSEVSGYYFTDDLTIAGATVDSLQMGLASTSDIEYGIMGIGFTAGESSSTKYPNLIDALYSQGLISAKAYSLYLVSQTTHS